MARRELIFDWNLIDRMLEAGCGGQEISGHFGCHPDTLYRRAEEHYGITWSLYMQQKKACGKAMLRVAQFNLALSGERTMLVWLGKQRLNQCENPTQLVNFNGKLAEFLDNIKKMTLPNNQVEQNPKVEVQVDSEAEEDIEIESSLPAEIEAQWWEKLNKKENKYVAKRT